MTDDHGQDGTPERRRPVGGAAAWRRVEERPLRGAHDEAPERTRYRRAPLVEQLREAWSDFRHNRLLVGVVLLLFGGWIVVRVLTPTPVRLGDLRAGDCLYVRPADPDVGPPVGAVGEIQARLARDGAEYASCALTHSHEVIAVVELGESAGWPGIAPLRDSASPTCGAAFDELPGDWRDVLALVVVVPDEAGWASDERRGACLVQRADRTYLDRPVR